MKNLSVEDIKKISNIESILNDLYDDKSMSSRKIIAESEIENLFNVGSYDSKKIASIESRLNSLLNILHNSNEDVLLVNRYFIKTCLLKIRSGYCLSADIVQYLNYLNEVLTKLKP